MKKAIIVSFASFFCLLTNGQYAELNWDTITFETSSPHIKIDTSSQNIWQIGIPNKIFLNHAYSLPNAIFTDSSTQYPRNNISYFDLYISEINVDWYPEDIFIDIKHKYDTDSLKDGGYISVSYDLGYTWMNIINDTLYQYDNSPNEHNPFVENLYSKSDTLFNGEFGFSGNSGDWIITKISWFILPMKSSVSLGDTMIIRFNFISDSVDTGQEGWMIDDIRLYSKDFGNYITNKEDIQFNIYPNPMNESVTIEFSQYQQKVSIEIIDFRGQALDKMIYYSARSINYNRNGIKSGLYVFKVQIDDKLIKTRKLLIE